MSTPSSLVRRRLAASALVVALLAAVAVAMGTQVPRWLSPQEPNSTDAAFSAAVVTLSAAGTDTALSLEDVEPGGSRVAPLALRNDSGAPVAVTVTSMTTEDALAGKVDLLVKTGVADCSPAGFAASGAVLVERRGVGSVAGQEVLDGVAGTHGADGVDGAGAGAGLVVSPGATTNLCVWAGLASSWQAGEVGDSATVATWRVMALPVGGQG